MFKRRKFVFDDEAKYAFLEHLAENGRIPSAARHIGTLSTVAKAEIKADSEFAEAVEEALLLYNDKIIGEIHRRAIEGVEKGIYYKGDRIDTELVYSDNLLIAHAKANIEKYRDKSKQEVVITGGVLVAPATAATAESWLADNSPKAELPAPKKDSDERIIDVESVEPVPV